MADSDVQPTFAAALAAQLRARAVSQKELARRLAGPSATDRQIENKRTGILRWLAGKHEPEEGSARQVEQALGLDQDALVALLDRKPRGRTAAVNRDQQIADLREDLEAVREEVQGLADDLAELRSAIALPGGDPPRGHVASGGLG